MVEKEKALKILRQQQELIPELKTKKRFSPDFKKWKRDTEIAIQKIFGENTRHIKDFTKIDYYLPALSLSTPESRLTEMYVNGLNDAGYILESFIEEINTYPLAESSVPERDCIAIIEQICLRFHRVARRLRTRYNNRPPLDVEDEYDVQDLLEALLLLEFNDIRPEEPTPSHAGKSSRMDFLLKQEKIVIEVKKTRKNLGAKEISEQLIIDQEWYKTHSDCETLICFIYDPDERITNPSGIENDLNSEKDGFIFKVIIAPREV